MVESARRHAIVEGPRDNVGHVQPTLASAQAATLVNVQPSTPPPSGYGLRRDAFVTTLYHDTLGRLPESSVEKF